MYNDNLTIALDGYSSTGKSSFAKLIAAKLGYLYVDSGAMYRVVTLHCIEAGLFKETEEPAIDLVIKELPAIEISFRRNEKEGLNLTYLGDRMVEKEIRSMFVSGKVSYISTIAEVRVAMVRLQREMSKSGGVVMDGRDIGTVVFPDAEIKIFMTASADIRADRRHKELKEKGVEEDFADVLHNISERDRIDSGREASPLKRADDATLLDNSSITIEEQLIWFFDKYKDILNRDENS